jgi:hypothetical protein
MIIHINKKKNETKLSGKTLQKDYSYFENNALSVFIFGYPVDYAEMDWVSPAFVAEKYEEGAMGFLETIDGIYSIVIIDKIAQKQIVITDRVGIYTMFYAISKEHIYIGDRVLEIRGKLEASVLNERAILEFLNLGFKIGNKTFFKEISEFEPASIYTITAEVNEIKRKVYWSVFNYQSHNKIDKEDFRHKFNSNLDVVSALEEKIVTPISGGKDTRMLMSAILHRKERIHCYTFGPKNHGDILSSTKICNHFNIKHNIVELNDEWAKKIDLSLVSTEMNINGIGPFFFNYHVKEALEREKGQANMALQGELGNQLWRHHPYGYAVPSSVDIGECADFMIQKLTRVLYFKTDLRGSYEGLYNEKAIGEVYSALKESVCDDLSKLDKANKPSDFSEFFILRTLCYNLYSNILKYIGRHIKLFLPNLQRELLEQLHLLTIPQRVRGEYNDYIIEKNNRFLATLVYRNSGRVVKYLKMILNLITEKLFRFSLFAHPELHNYPKWIRKYHREEFLRTLDYDHMVLAKMFNREKLESMVKKFISNKYSIKSKKEIMLKYSNQHFIYNLYSLEHWLQTNHLKY